MNNSKIWSLWFAENEKPHGNSNEYFLKCLTETKTYDNDLDKYINIERCRGRYKYWKKKNPDFITVGRKLDKNGNVTSQRQVVLKDEFELKPNQTLQGKSEFIGGVWYKTKFEQPEFDREAFVEEMKQYAPVYPTLKREVKKETNIFVLDPADLHIGKLASMLETGENYNLQIAKELVQQAILRLLDKAKNYEIEKIVFVGGNDILHTDNLGRSTTAGTPQDSCAMWYDSFQAAKDLYVWAVEACLTVADVHFIYCVSNHDYQSGYYLCDSIYSWFRNNKNVTFDVDMKHRKYLVYGVNLLGFTHGDGAKENDLPNLMAVECRKAWSETVYGYFYLHHLHHKIRKNNKRKVEKDNFNVTTIRTNQTLITDSVNVEYLRTVSATDSWHHRNGYQYAPKAIEGFLHSFDKGQIARFSEFI